MAALENKTVILVTHQVEFLSEVDKILVVLPKLRLLFMLSMCTVHFSYK